MAALGVWVAELIRLGDPDIDAVILELVEDVIVILLLGELDPEEEGVMVIVMVGVFEGMTDVVLLLEPVIDLVPVLVGDPVLDGVPVIVTDDVTVFDAVMVVVPVLDGELVPDFVMVIVIDIVTVGVCDRYAHTRFVVIVQATVSD